MSQKSSEGGVDSLIIGIVSYGLLRNHQDKNEERTVHQYPHDDMFPLFIAHGDLLTYFLP